MAVNIYALALSPNPRQWYVLGMTMVLGPVARKTVLAIEELAAKLGHDAQLPSERVLAADFGVSRSTLRVALDYLEQKGRIKKRGLTGRYTNLERSQSQTRTLSKGEVEARIIFESALIADLAVILTEPQKLALGDMLEKHITDALAAPNPDPSVVGLARENQLFHQHLSDLHPNTHARKMLQHASRDNEEPIALHIPIEVLITQHQLIIQAIILGNRNMTHAAVRLNLASEFDSW